jgi:hypothetical protein
MKTGTITSCEFRKEFQSKYGVIYYHRITLNNGDVGEIGTKQKNPEKLMPGKVLTYEFTPADNPSWPGKIKEVQPETAPQAAAEREQREQHIAKAVALKAAVDLVAAGKVDISLILQTADKFLTWLK